MQTVTSLKTDQLEQKHRTETINRVQFRKFSTVVTDDAFYNTGNVVVDVR